MKEVKTLIDGEPFVFNPRTTMLLDICCDCVSCHTRDFEVLPDGNIQVKWFRKKGMSSYLRRYKRGKLQQPNNKSNFILVNTKDISNMLRGKVI